MMRVDAELFIAILSFVLSATLAAFYIRDRRHAKFSVANDYANCLVAWHREVVDLLIRSRLLNREVDSLEHQSDLARLSALIEHGRFYFPNIDKADGFGAEKPPAYRGYRNLALDFLVASYHLLHNELTPEACTKLEMLQRHFTSIVFAVVRPKGRLESIRAITDRYFTTDECFEDFLVRENEKLLEYVWRVPRRR